MLITFILVLTCLSAAEVPNSPADTLRRWAPRIAPVSLADPRRPTLQVGIEYFLLPQLSLGVDFGTRVVLAKSFRQPEQQVRHQTYRAEVRYYLPLARRSQQFVAVEGFYVPYASTNHYGVLERKGAFFTYDQARIVRHTWGTGLKYGWLYPFGRQQRWWVETALGLGLRRVPARYSRIRNEQPADSASAYNYRYQEWQLGTQPADGGYVDRLHLTASFRVGYRLLRRVGGSYQ
ncbi:DUF3575 domain-containing protein [Hymenobacter taeanensis]|uniref:DUF3575 domain-containing protein n=1 Tax=Hymenobacter taeanensis TaxID=2735321 RepID=A0A6M6BDH6_9BACT|nr:MULTISPECIES: DUF3575 domain-containing protein [Hymenobacter]QJX46032.1 DUF3575 domain-containing protein [Hymenobacter taeanensis]UOQ79886.1 DUF3575 domain-containing protein [Hymenobacter sp. 5414T-23]